MVPIRSTCSHCGQDIVTSALLVSMNGPNQGAFHPGCWQQVKDGQTIAALSKKIDDLTEVIQSSHSRSVT